MIQIILILALVLRLIGLNQSLWLDEAVQAVTAQKSFSYIFQEIKGDFHPPLYHFLMHFWVRIFGSSEIVLRIPSVLFGVVTVYLLYKLAIHVHSKFVAILAAIFLATSQFHIYYSQEARMYSMACFLATLSMFYFFKIKELTKLGINKLFLLYFISTLGLIYTDYYGFLVVLAQGIILLTQKKYKFLILNTCFLILVYLPWLPILISQMETGMIATQLLPGWGRLVNTPFLKVIPLTLVKFTIGRITIFNRILYELVITGVLGLLGVIGINYYKNFKNNKNQSRFFPVVIFLWFTLPLLLSWVASLWIPNFQPFRLLLILPAFYLLLAMGIQGASDSMIQIIESGLILVVSLCSLFVYFFNPYFHREDWRGLVGFLKSESATVILPSETSSWPIKYYDPRAEISIDYGGIGVEEVGNLSKIKNLGDKIFYIRYLVPLFDPNEKILAELDARGYTKIKEFSFNQIPVWEYRRLE